MIIFLYNYKFKLKFKVKEICITERRKKTIPKKLYKQMKLHNKTSLSKLN